MGSEILKKLWDFCIFVYKIVLILKWANGHDQTTIPVLMNTYAPAVQNWI